MHACIVTPGAYLTSRLAAVPGVIHVGRLVEASEDDLAIHKDAAIAWRTGAA